MVNVVIQGLKKPSWVKRSRAMISPLSTNHGSNVIVDIKELKHTRLYEASGSRYRGVKN